MKKITLVVLAAASAIGTAFGQANISVLAPAYVGDAAGQLPSGITQVKHLRSCFLIKKSELPALTGSIVNSIGLSYVDGSGATISSGNFTLYLENTSDNTYQKGTNFATAITNMTVSYNGVLNIPTGTNASTVNLTTTPTFTYAGNSIYVALEWDEVSPAPNANNTNAAFHKASNVGMGNGLCAIGITSVSPAVTTLTVTDNRPCLLFNAVNTATNEVEVVSMKAMGKTSKLDPTPQTIEAVVKNKSVGTLNNIPVTLAITGANTFNNVQTITSLPAGAQITVSFPGYSPTTNGNSNMGVTVAVDQNTVNNSASWVQEVSCEKISLTLPIAAPANFFVDAFGANAPGAFYGFKHTTSTVASSLTGVNNYVLSDATYSNSGKQLYATLFDANGALVATGKTITIGSSQMDVFYNYPFDAPVALTPNTTYYIGLSVPGTGFFPMTYVPAISNVDYYYIPLTGGAPSQIPSTAIGGYLAIEATMGYSNTIISASATRTTVCNKSNETTMLVANGSPGLTYTWTPGTSSGSSVVVTPSVSSASGAINYAVVAKDPVSGCSSNKAVVTVSLANCTGFDNNGDFGTSISVFPNPSVNGKTYIKGLDGSSKVDVFNVLGQVVLTLNPGESEAELDLSSQPAGSYLVKITSDSNKSRTMKILNQN